MKKLIYLFLIIILLVPKQSKAQDGAAAAVGAAAVVGGIIGAAVSAENNRERLELIATNYILKNYPNLRGFSVKVLSHNSTTLKDLSGVKCVIFAFSEYETSMGDKLKNEVLLMFDSNSWINKYGTKTYQRIAVRLDRNKWNTLLKKYYAAASPFPMNEDNTMPIYQYVGSDSEDSTIEGVLRLKNYDSKTNFDYYKKLTDTFNFRNNYQNKKNGLWKNTYKKIGFPFYNKLNGDTYFLNDFNDDIKIVFNENKLGFYIKETNELIQMKEGVVKQVTDYIN
jgi:hypothetical protein|tara:strand:+ start:20 stop:862 length:843 start_codon:yes stop_codon:yes gene_type:complete